MASRLSAFAPSLEAVRDNEQLELLLMFHDAQSSVEFMFRTPVPFADRDPDPVTNGNDHCRLCPEEVPRAVEIHLCCKVCGLYCCLNHARPRLIEDQSRRFEVCELCVRNL